MKIPSTEIVKLWQFKDTEKTKTIWELFQEGQKTREKLFETKYNKQSSWLP